MRIIILTIIQLLIFQLINGQNDTLNQSYFSQLKKELQADSIINQIKYKCKLYDNGTVKEQHMYVKYKNDSIDRFWRVGECFHYYENGQLMSNTNIDIKSRVFTAQSISYTEQGDTSLITIWDNYKGRTFPIHTVFNQGDLGKVYELQPDLYHEITFKNGIRIKKKTTLCPKDYCMTLRIEYYKKDGSIKNIKDNSSQLEIMEKK